MTLAGALGHLKDWIPSKLKEKQRSSGQVVEHKGKTWGKEPSGALPGTVILSITASGLSLGSNIQIPDGESCPPQILLPKSCGGQLWPAWTNRAAQHCSSLERRGFVWSALLFHPVATRLRRAGMSAATTFPRLTLHCDLCLHTVLAARSLFLPQSSSSPELFCQDERFLSELHGVLW